MRIVDLGGPGNSTAILKARWPDAAVTGLDSDADMLNTARREHPGIAFAAADIAEWQPRRATTSSSATPRCNGSATTNGCCRASKTNGKAERFIQTALREWAYAQAYPTSQRRAEELPFWLHRYNWHRPHGGIKAKTPISRLRLARGQPIEAPQLEPLPGSMRCMTRSR